MGGLGVTASGLARVRRTGSEWGSASGWFAQERLSEQGNTVLSAYSPDGRWIVFNRADEGVVPGSSPLMQSCG